MATIDTSGADAVRVVSDERLDIPDFDAATFGLNSEQLTRVMGVLVGSVLGTTQPFMGCASRPSTSYDSGTKFLTINGCLFYQGGSASVPSTAPAGRLIAYDPTQAWQLGVTGVDLDTFAPSTACVVWALPTMDTHSNLETRKRWLPGASAETSFSTQTRTRTIISNFQALAVGASPPSSSWFPLFKINSWTAGSPNVTEISMWDGTPNLSLVGNTATGMPSGNPVPNLSYILYTLRKGVAYILDNTGGDNWTEAAANPYSGLKQLDDDITAIEADITSLDSRVDLLELAMANRVKFGVLTAFSIYKTGGLWDFEYPVTGYRVSVFNVTGGTTFGFKLDNAVNFTSITAVTVTMRSTSTTPTSFPVPAVEIVNAVPPDGEFIIYFWDGGTKVAPDDLGFCVQVLGTYI